MQRNTTLNHSTNEIKRANETAATVIASSEHDEHAHRIGGRGMGEERGGNPPPPAPTEKDVPPGSAADEGAGAATEELASNARKAATLLLDILTANKKLLQNLITRSTLETR